MRELFLCSTHWDMPLGSFRDEGFALAISADPEAPSYAKTIEALERAEKARDRARYRPGGTGQLRSPSSQAR